MKIWKFLLEIDDVQNVTMPAGARILTAQLQGEALCLWALCDEQAPKVKRAIRIYGTGHPLPLNPGEYIATFQLNHGALIFHVFEIPST